MRIFFYLLFFLSLIVYSCGDSIPIGADLLDDGSVDLNYNDTFELPARTIAADPPIIFRNVSTYNSRTFLVGKIDDPVFGSYSSESYFSASLLASIPDFSDAELDSVILSLPLDSLGMYGNPDEVHNIEIYQLEEEFTLDPGDTLYADTPLAYDPQPLSSLSTSINYSDSATVYNPTGDTTLVITPQLRFEMDTSFWSPVVRDTSISSSAEALSAYLRGFAIRSKDAVNSMFGINLQNSSPATVEIYFTIGDTAKGVHFMDLGAFRHSYFEHDISGTPVEEAIADGNDENRLYLQSMAGPNIEIDLSNVEMIEDEILNKAVLEIYIEEPEDIYPPVSQILVSYDNDDAGELTIIEDLALVNSGYFFGGDLNSKTINGVSYNVYTVNITNHVNNIIDGRVDTPLIVITAIQKAERPNRSILYGPSHPELAPVLKIISTKP